MYNALDMGVTVDAFWEMSPRALWVLTQERIRSMERRAGKGRRSGEGTRIGYIPR